MSDFIETPTIGEILNEEFLIPLGISAYKLAQEIKVPTSRIQDILHNRRKITVDTSLRLAKFFGLSDGYFMSLQDDIDIRNAKIELAPQLEEIKTYAYAKKIAITKVRSRQRFKPAAVQPVVMWTPALGRFRGKNDKRNK